MNKLTKIGAVSVFAVIALMLFAAPALAQFTQNTPPPVDITDISGVENTLISILNWLYTIFFIVAAGFFLFSAFLYLTAGGNEENLKKAKTTFLYAVIAVGVALIAFGMDNLIASFLTN